MPFSITNIAEALSVEQNRRRYILLFVSYITSGTMLVLGLRHLFSEDYLLQFILFGCAFCFLLNAAWFHASQQLERACLIDGILIACFVVGLVVHGGFEQTALYWVFPFPPILYGLLGRKRGTVLNLSLLIILTLLLYGPALGQAQYQTAESSRFLASLLTLIVACGINEHFRERSHHSMDLLQRSKDNQANSDALTGLANRRFLDQTLPQTLLQQPEQLLPMALIMVDLDHFKYINDSFGHAEGDRVLQQIARLFRSKLRQPDIACRYGGEEFLLLLPQTQLTDAARVAEKIRQTVAQQRFLPQHPELVITCSFGVALLSDAEDFDEALRQADQLLYQAKADGRNLVRS